MGLTLKLTRMCCRLSSAGSRSFTISTSPSHTFTTNTVGDGPYNAWLDPILTDEWQMLGWNNVSEMTKFGNAGSLHHGTFDTWSPGYLMFIAATHNGISRLYETFGNGGADTVERTSVHRSTRGPGTGRTRLFREPGGPRRNNNNYEETGVLTALSYFANSRLFLRNFYLKSKRSIETTAFRSGSLRPSG